VTLSEPDIALRVQATGPSRQEQRQQSMRRNRDTQDTLRLLERLRA
jgi:hypothetical protein